MMECFQCHWRGLAHNITNLGGMYTMANGNDIIESPIHAEVIISN